MRESTCLQRLQCLGLFGSLLFLVAGCSGSNENGMVTPLPFPTLRAVAPTSGPTTGGTAVTLTGTGFQAGATLTIGGTAATQVSVVSATQLTATTPAGMAGPTAVVVTNLDGQGATLADGFIYVAPPPSSAPLYLAACRRENQTPCLWLVSFLKQAITP